jgi:hypothetical protein
MKFFFSSRRACLAAFEISLALFISGCAIYKTPELPNDQLATIVVADKDRPRAHNRISRWRYEFEIMIEIHSALERNYELA